MKQSEARIGSEQAIGENWLAKRAVQHNSLPNSACAMNERNARPRHVVQCGLVAASLLCSHLCVDWREVIGSKRELLARNGHNIRRSSNTRIARPYRLYILL